MPVLIEILKRKEVNKEKSARNRWLRLEKTWLKKKIKGGKNEKIYIYDGDC